MYFTREAAACRLAFNGKSAERSIFGPLKLWITATLDALAGAGVIHLECRGSHHTDSTGDKAGTVM